MPEILHQFVDKIVVHHRQRLSVADNGSPATEEQKVEIFYNCVGKIEAPDVAKVPPAEVSLPTRKGVAVQSTFAGRGLVPRASETSANNYSYSQA